MQYEVGAGNSASALGEQGGDPSFQDGGQEDVCELLRITLLSLSRKVYSRILERRNNFHPDRRTLDQLRVHGNLLVDLKKAFNHITHGILWEVLQEYVVQGPLPICTIEAGAWFPLMTVSQQCTKSKVPTKSKK